METNVTTVLSLQNKVSEMGSHVLTGLFQGKTGGVTCQLATETGHKYEISVTSKRLYGKKKATKKAPSKKKVVKKAAPKKVTKKVTAKKKTTTKRKVSAKK